MKKIPYQDRKELYPYRKRIKGNYKGQEEDNDPLSIKTEERVEIF